MGWGIMRQAPAALGPLFDAPAQQHSRTSVEAAERAAPRSGAQRAQVLAHLRDQGEAGATDEEIQTALDLGGSTQRPRRVELVHRGLVRDSGRTRPTRAGRSSVVWVAA